MANPVDIALEALQLELDLELDELEKEGFARKRAPGVGQRELQMWHDWNNSGRKPDKLRPLMKSLQPLVQNRQKLWENRVRDIPPAAIKAEFQDQVLGALETYNPQKSQLNTWITHRIKKANRFMTTYQNPARIGEKRKDMISAYQNAEQTLHQQLGRTPTTHEIADYAKLPQRSVALLGKELRKSFPTGGFESDPASLTPSRTQEMVSLLPYDLTSDENAVFEYIHGVGGKPQLGTGDIARKLNMSAPKVSRLKGAIAKKWATYED